jgi:tRNA modification GTPase
MQPADTIAAVATPPGAGGVGIVRVSGPAAAAIGERIAGRALKPRQAHFSVFRDAAGAPLDRGLALYFPAPNSFTGEHVLELHAHGSPVVLELLLRSVCSAGARRARAGEFSERAFLNGKLDLVQAEAVADLIAAGSEAAARAALRSLDGEFSARVHGVFQALVRVRAWLEAALDFPEEEIDFLSTPQLHADVAEVLAATTALTAEARRGALLRDGLHVVIVGRPNAGKSSLLNALAQSERAIVTEIPGTTRDLVRENVVLDGIALTLVDTAGLRESADPVEQEGMRRARAELARADAVLLVTDDADSVADRALIAGAAAGATRLVVHNKIDLRGGEPRREATADGAIALWLSATTGAGLDLLRAELARCAGHDASGAGSFSARSRHVEALQRVAEHLAQAQQQLAAGVGELAAEELRQAQHTLGEITGEFRSDDLLGAIFSSFCIGK